jgi:hypothetical protein
MVIEISQTIDWMAKEEKALFAPYNAGHLGANLDEAKRLFGKVNNFAPTAKVIINCTFDLCLLSDVDCVVTCSICNVDMQ